MPSPFPGMDPYLESPHWAGFHTQMITEIARQLTPKLRPRYVALVEERFVLETHDGVSIASTVAYPDVSVTTTFGGAAETAVSVSVAPYRLVTAMPEAVPHVSVEIRDVANRELVTAIEVLSPSNKRGEGRAEYLNRRATFLRSHVHLLEIDLLRAGQRLPMRESLPPAPYYVFLSRAEDRPLTDVWPISLRKPLPQVPVPLLAQDRDVQLDLQRAVAAIYDDFGYDLLVDYREQPKVALQGEDSHWAEETLRLAGLHD